MSKLHSVTAVLCFFAAGILNLEAEVIKISDYELYTPDDLTYQFLPAIGGVVNFKVKAPRDAHIALTTAPKETKSMYEVFLGGWNNGDSVIRKDKEFDIVLKHTKNILSDSEFRGFWIKWGNGRISVGKEGEEEPFMSHDDRDMFHPGYVGFSTAYGATGNWIIDEPPKKAYRWVEGKKGEHIPPEALSAGFDEDSEEMILVARAKHDLAILPGRLSPSQGILYVPWGGAEYEKSEYEILCGTDGKWVESEDGEVPPGAFEGGESERGETLYIGRVQDKHKLMVGKVHPSHKLLYVSYGGKELAYTHYDVLVV